MLLKPRQQKDENSTFRAVCLKGPSIKCPWMMVRCKYI